MASNVELTVHWKVTQTYQYRNRVTKSIVKYRRFLFEIKNKPSTTQDYVNCVTHDKLIVCKNHTEAIAQMRKPWLWCGECAAISDEIIPHVCPSCDGAGELAGDYFSDDGMFSCGQCQGRGTI